MRSTGLKEMESSEGVQSSPPYPLLFESLQSILKVASAFLGEGCYSSMRWHFIEETKAPQRANSTSIINVTAPYCV